MKINRRIVIVWVSTGLWAISTCCVLSAIGFVIACTIQDRLDGDHLANVRLAALAIGFLPWVFAYAGTRVLYGIETILEG